jgi:hypothetical protein
MGTFWKIFADNRAIIMMAPGLFAAALALGWLAGWVVIRLVYNQRLAHQQDMITNLRAVLEEKLPASFLPPPLRKHSRQMSFGLILIFVGIGAALLGALIIATDKSVGDKQVTTKMMPSGTPSTPASKSAELKEQPNFVPLPVESPENRVFVDNPRLNRTVWGR